MSFQPRRSHGLPARRSDVRRAAATALGRFGDPQALPELITALKDPNPGVRQAAAVALGRIGHPDAIPSLLNLIGDVGMDEDLGHLTDSAFRCKALTALIYIDTSHPNRFDLFPILVNCLNDQNRNMQKTAVAALAHYSSSVFALEPLLSYWDKLVADDIYYAERGIGRDYVSDAVSTILKRLESSALVTFLHIYLENRKVAGLVFNEIGNRLDDEVCKIALIELAHDEREFARVQALSHLGKVRDEANVSAFLAALDSDQYAIRTVALKHLGTFQDSRFVAPLFTLLDDTNPEIIGNTILHLGRMVEDESDITALLNLLQDLLSDRTIFPDYSDTYEREVSLQNHAVRVLRHIMDARAVPALANSVKAWYESPEQTRDIQFLERLVSLLGDLRDPNAVPALTQVLRDTDTTMEHGFHTIQAHHVAAEALGKIGDETAIAALTSAFENTDDENFQIAVLEAFCTTAAPEVLPVVVRIITDPKTSRKIIEQAIAVFFAITDFQALREAKELLQKDGNELHPIAVYALHFSGISSTEDMLRMMEDGVFKSYFTTYFDQQTLNGGLHIAQLLKQLDVPSALGAAMEHEDENVRYFALQMWRERDYPGLFEAAVETLNRSDFSMIAAVITLMSFKSEATFEALKSAVWRVENRLSDQFIIRALTDYGEPAIPTILRAVGSDTANHVIRALREIGTPRALAIIPKFIKMIARGSGSPDYYRWARSVRAEFEAEPPESTG